MKLITLFICCAFLFSCDSSKFSSTPISQFEGKWKIMNRPIWKDCIIEISGKEDNLSGKLIELNQNKYVQLFADSGQVVISSIKRKSNFEFILSEKKIASELFSVYGQSTTNKLNATFNKKNEILFGKNGINGRLKRIK